MAYSYGSSAPDSGMLAIVPFFHPHPHIKETNHITSWTSRIELDRDQLQDPPDILWVKTLHEKFIMVSLTKSLQPTHQPLGSSHLDQGAASSCFSASGLRKASARPSMVISSVSDNSSPETRLDMSWNGTNQGCQQILYIHYLYKLYVCVTCIYLICIYVYNYIYMMYMYIGHVSWICLLGRCWRSINVPEEKHIMCVYLY